jgi:hypothetical protein
MILRILLAVAAISATSLAALAACEPAESGFVKACDAAISARVNGYQRLNVTQSNEALALADLFQNEPAVLKTYQSSGARSVTHVALIRYKTMDGQMQTAKCTDGTLDGREPTSMKELVKIDGQTNIEYLASKFARARR